MAAVSSTAVLLYRVSPTGPYDLLMQTPPKCPSVLLTVRKVTVQLVCSKGSVWEAGTG